MKASNGRHIERTFAWLSKKAATLGGVLILVMMLAIVVDVSGRYLFNSPLLGGIELNRTLLVVVVFFGLAYTQLEDGHIRMDLLMVRVSPRLKLILEIFSLVIALSVYVYITYTTIPVTIRSILRGEYETGLIPFPMWPARLFMSIGLFILTLQLVADLKSKLTTRDSSRSSTEKTPETTG